MGQRRRRELLRDAEGRAGPRRGLGHPGGGAHRALRLPRALLQWTAAAFGAWLPQSASVRATARTGSGGNLTQVSTKPGQVHVAVDRQHACVPAALLYLICIGGHRTFVLERPDNSRSVRGQLEVLFRAHCKGERSQELDPLLGGGLHFGYVVWMSGPPLVQLSPVSTSEHSAHVF